ncbi:MAG: cupin domain-containing protein [Nitrospira sp.]|nr:cupin domain-containing protein [Nitrospira sp.]
MNRKSGPHFTAVDLGPLSQLEQYTYQHPLLPRATDGKVFLNQLLGLTSSEISVNKLPPRTSMPFYHTHRVNEEIYLFVKGEGEFQIDGKVFPIQEGTVIRVAPDGERCWRNTSDTDSLYYIVIQACAGSYDGHTVEDGVGVQKRVSWVGKEPA